MKSVLIVENNGIVAMDIAQILKDIGFEVEIAADGVEGLEKIKQKAYDLIITNYKMPDMNGEGFYKAVFALNRDLAKKILFISARITKFLKSTSNPYLIKPFDPEQLLEAVKKIIPGKKF